MPPVHLLIKPASGGCNAHCRYCFYRDEMDHRRVGSFGVMTAETQRQVLENALKNGEGTCTISYQGGEPTLAGLDFFRRGAALERALKPEGVTLRHAIQTSGLSMTREWAEFFAGEGYLVGLSLDGPRELHEAQRGEGTFDRVLEAAALLDRAGAEYNILTVVTEASAHRAERLYRFFRKQGFRYLQFIPCLDPFDGAGEAPTAESYGAFLCRLFDLWYRDVMAGNGVSIRLFDDFVRMMAGLPPTTCGSLGVCTLQTVVEADGSVYPCDFYALDEYRLGSLREQTPEELRRAPAADRFLREGARPSPLCGRCALLPLCRGGCRRYRDSHGHFRYCRSYQAFFAKTLPRFQQLLRLAEGQREA